jgi:hypothetical protein
MTTARSVVAVDAVSPEWLETGMLPSGARHPGKIIQDRAYACSDIPDRRIRGVPESTRFLESPAMRTPRLEPRAIINTAILKIGKVQVRPDRTEQN